MAPQLDVEKPADDPFALIGPSWPVESESAYHSAEVMADDASTTAQSQAQSVADAEGKMTGEKGKAADSVSDGYGNAATHLGEQSQNFTTISAWMTDAAGKIRGAKKHIANLVSAGTSEIRDALSSETTGTAVSPSSSELTAKYRDEIASISTKLKMELDNIGHSLHGDVGASTTPAYVRTAPTSTAPTIQQAAHREASGQSPAPEPHQLPEMPRATATTTAETPSTLGTPSAPVPASPINPTLAGLISPAASSSPTGSGTPGAPSANTPTGQQQGRQFTEQRQTPKAPGLPGVPNIQLPDLPAAAASIATAVTSAAGGAQLPTATAPASVAPQVPASTGVTPGTSGAAPVPPVPPGLGPIGGLGTPPVTQAAPAPTGTPAVPGAGAQAPSPQSTPAPRGPVADTAWLQKTYGLAPGVEAPKPETPAIPALFITSLPEPEAHLHRTLATLRQQFEGAGWSQPMAVATLKQDMETLTVYVTSDAVSLWPSGISLPENMLPVDELVGTARGLSMSGSAMVTDKLTSLIPQDWTLEALLSTVPGDEHGQPIEQYQALVDAEELLPCTVVRGEDGVPEEQALQVFAKATLGQKTPGVSDLNADSAQLKAARWVGTQPTGYLDVLSRWHLSDASAALGSGRWGDVLYAIEKFQSIRDTKRQVA